MEGTLPLVAAAIAGAGAASACAAVRAGNFSSSSATSRWQATPTGAGAGRVVGLLHPGSMGASIGCNLRMNGARVLWASEGRSADSRARAEAQGLEDAGSIDELVAQASVIISVCPPAAALQLAQRVAKLKFAGTFVDANAISPATAAKVGAVVRQGGARFVDGGIVGGPAYRPGPDGPTTRMYLSGEGAADIAGLFGGTNLGVPIVCETQASAMKIAYASWTKGSSALLINVNAYAKASGVWETLVQEWRLSEPHSALSRTNGSKGIGPKAWRWVGEMQEIASAYRDVGLSGDFHSGAAVVYENLAHLKGTQPTRSAADMAGELADHAAKVMGIKWGVANEADF